MIGLAFLLYTYMSQQNYSTTFNTTTISEWTSSLPQWSSPTGFNTTTIADWTSTSLPQWAYPSQWSSPPMVLPSTPDMMPYAVFYFLSGAMFFLGSAYMVLSTSSRSASFTAIDGIATMSDFTKTNVMDYLNEHKPNRELIALVETNGMRPEEFLYILAGNKRARRASNST
jgi:hypothetical protein